MNHARTLMRVVALAVILVGSVSPEVHAQRLGRLFTSPVERATLDEMRVQAGIVRSSPEPAPPETEPELPPVQVSAPSGPSVSRLIINGVVRRNRGPSTVWVNGDLVERGGVSREGIAVETVRGAGGRIRLRLPSGSGTVALRPGQQVDVDSGVLLEAYEKRVTESGSRAFRPEDNMPLPVNAKAPSSNNDSAGDRASSGVGLPSSQTSGSGALGVVSGPRGLAPRN